MTSPTLPPLAPLPDDENGLGWHALNYRTAHTIHAEQCWQELLSCVTAIRLADRKAMVEWAASQWQPIETAPEPNKGQRTQFVVCGFGVRDGTYTTDPYCVWRTFDGDFARWPHPFRPTHWMPLPAPPSLNAAESSTDNQQEKP